MSIMLRKQLLLILATLTSASLTACIVPYHFVDASAVSGQVVNRSTGRPVVAAVVSQSTGQTSVQTRTDQNGDFSLPAIQHWGLIPYPTDGYIDGVGSLQVDAPGYKGFETATDERDHTGIKHVHVTLTPHT